MKVSGWLSTVLYVSMSVCVQCNSPTENSNSPPKSPPSDQSPHPSGMNIHETDLLYKSALGIDPVRSDPLQFTDPGVRGQIFQPLVHTNGDVLVHRDYIWKFIKESRDQEEDYRIPNYNLYRKLMMKPITFEDNTPNVNVDRFNFTKFVGYANYDSGNYKKIRQFFEETNGEVAVKYRMLKTHYMSTNLNFMPKFTKHFFYNLFVLNEAAKHPDWENSTAIFREFVTAYGTHYQSETEFGSLFMYRKFYASKARDPEEDVRRDTCIDEAILNESNIRKINETSCSVPNAGCSGHEVFKKLSLKPVSISRLGQSLFNREPEQVSLSPSVITYKLQKISSLFKHNWFSLLLRNKGDTMNGTAMYEFFENKSAQYCKIMFGSPCILPTRGCGISSDCDWMEVCLTDSSEEGYSCKHPCELSTTPCGDDYTCQKETDSCRGYICVFNGTDEVLIAGGIADLHSTEPLTEVEAINMDTSLPALDRSMKFSSLTFFQSTFIYCGGDARSRVEEPSKACFKKREQGWPGASLLLQRGMVNHTAVTMGDSEIWFIAEDKVDIYDGTQHIRSNNLPFKSLSRHCAVSNGDFTYVIGVGQNYNEIWVNEEPRDETTWKKAGILNHGRKFHGCLWYASNIMITGGICAGHSVEIFNTESDKIWEVKWMSTRRSYHHMMLYNGKPTVVGGYDGKSSLDSLESYDLKTGEWSVEEHVLSKPRLGFSLAVKNPKPAQGNGHCCSG